MARMASTLLEHVLFQNDCTDPDCELHHPEVIEEDRERAAALAWYVAGVRAGIRDGVAQLDAVLPHVGAMLG